MKSIKNYTPDDFYAAWLAAHEGLSEAKSHELNAALVLLLVERVDEWSVLEQALNHARQAIEPSSPVP